MPLGFAIWNMTFMVGEWKKMQIQVSNHSNKQDQVHVCRIMT